jgi:p-cumate 2,3-dioxygenase beta subunit
MTDHPSVAAFERFIFDEVALLDEWRLDEWFALFADGATYHVPTAGAADTASPTTSLFYIADDYRRLRERIERLKSPADFVDYPRPHIRHFISNVRVLRTAGTETEVTCNFITYRSKNGVVETYFGHSLYRIDWAGDAFRIKSKRSTLDMDLLYPGKVSIII